MSVLLHVRPENSHRWPTRRIMRGIGREAMKFQLLMVPHFDCSVRDRTCAIMALVEDCDDLRHT